MKKKFLCISIIIALLFSCIPNISVDAASKKSQVNATTKKLMSSIKKFDASAINKYVNSWGDKSSPSEFNNQPYMKKYFKWSNKKLTYKIISTKVSGDTAKVKVRVKYINSKNFTDYLLSLSILELMGKEDASDEEAEKIVEKHSKTAYKTSIKEKRKYKTKTFTIVYGKYDNKWKVKKVSSNLHNAMYANFPYNTEHFWDE